MALEVVHLSRVHGRQRRAPRKALRLVFLDGGEGEVLLASAKGAKEGIATRSSPGRSSRSASASAKGAKEGIATSVRRSSGPAWRSLGRRERRAPRKALRPNRRLRRRHDHVSARQRRAPRKALRPVRPPPELVHVPMRQRRAPRKALRRLVVGFWAVRWCPKGVTEGRQPRHCDSTSGKKRLARASTDGVSEGRQGRHCDLHLGVELLGLAVVASAKGANQGIATSWPSPSRTSRGTRVNAGRQPRHCDSMGRPS